MKKPHAYALAHGKRGATQTIGNVPLKENALSIHRCYRPNMRLTSAGERVKGSTSSSSATTQWSPEAWPGARIGCHKRLVILLLSTSGLWSCAPLPKAEYWDGWFVHLHHPKYTFQIPDGWRRATVSDYPSLGFNRTFFQTLDEASRNAAMERAELEMQARDTGLISPRGAWIQVSSAGAPGGWYTRRDLRFGLSDRQKQDIWQQFLTRLRQTATPTDKPSFILESLDFEYYGGNRPLRLRFRADESRGSIHWTVLEFYGSSGVVTIAHMGIPEDREEGIAGLEVLARSFRFN